MRQGRSLRAATRAGGLAAAMDGLWAALVSGRTDTGAPSMAFGFRSYSGGAFYHVIRDVPGAKTLPHHDTEAARGVRYRAAGSSRFGVQPHGARTDGTP